jgi:PKD domain
MTLYVRRQSVLRRAISGMLVLLPILVAWSVWPAGAAAGEWELAGPFGAGVSYSYGAHPRLAMNGAGEAALIFGFNGIRVSLRPVGGSFADPEWGGVLVSSEGVEGSLPDVAMDAAGDTIAVWRQSTGAHPQIYAAFRPSGGQFGPPTAVSPEGREASAPAVAIDSRGDATVAWLSNDGTSEVVQTATASPGGDFSSPVALSGNGDDASNVQVAMTSQGDAVVSWTRSSGGSDELEVAMRQAGGTFAAPNAQGDGEIVGEAQPASVPHVVTDAIGDTFAVWKGSGGAVREAYLAAGSSAFGEPVTLGETSGSPSAAMDEAGEAVVVWPSGRNVQVATASTGGVFGSPPEELISSSVAPSAPQVTIGANGATAVVWEANQNGGTTREGAFRALGATFAKPTGIYTTGTAVEGSLVVASDSAGDMVGVWDSSGLNDMESLLYDNGPTLSGVSMPATGQVGGNLSFSMAQPVSVWKPLSSVTWSFGDGSTATGLSASHLYTQPGTYQITATATDTQHSFPGIPGLFPEYVGNSTTQSITITPATAVPESQVQANTSAGAVESLSDFNITPRSFRASAAGAGPATVAGSRKAASTTAKATGATVSFALTAPGDVRFIVERAITGIIRGKKCVVTTTMHTRGGQPKHCTIFRALGHFTRNGSSGANRFQFTGRLNGHDLSPGSYVLTAVTGGSHSVSRRVTFRVLHVERHVG